MGISWSVLRRNVLESFRFDGYGGVKESNCRDKQNMHYVAALEDTVDSTIYRTRFPTQYRSILIKRDTISQTSNLYHSNSLILNENTFVKPENHFIMKRRKSCNHMV